MTIKVKLIWVGLLMGIILIGAYFLGGIKPRRERDRAIGALTESQSQLKDTVSSYNMVIKGKEITIAEQKTIILTQKDAIAGHILDKERLKALNIKTVRENVRLKMTINVLKDSLDMNINDTIIIHDHDTMNTYLRLPAYFNYKDEWITMNSNIGEDLMRGFSMSLPVDIDITMGEVKTGFLKREERVVLQTDNPYVDFLHVQSVKIEKEPLFYQKPLFKLFTHLVAFGGGFYLGGR